MLKVLEGFEIQWTYLNIRKTIHSKPISNILQMKKKLKAFPLSSGTKTGWLLSLLVFNVILEILT